MKKPDAPCFRCEDRIPGCHGSCEKFLAYKTARLDFNHNIYSNRQAERPAVLTKHIYADCSAYYHKKTRTEGKGKCTQ